VPSTAINTFDLAPIGPWYPGPPAKQKPVRLPPSVSYPKGTVLGEVVGTNEAQTITLTTGGTLGGTYTLSYGGVTTGAIAFNATAATVQAALEALATIGAGNVAVTGPTPTTSGGVLTVTFQNQMGYRDVAALTGSAASLTGTTPGLAIATATPGAGLANETQTIAASGTVSGGTFTVTYSGQTTAALAYNVSTADLQAALEGLSNVRIGNVAVTGTAGSIYVVNFRGALAGTNIAAVTIDNTAITGGGTYVVATTVGGAAGSGLHYAFDGTGADGRQVARAILPFAVTTDPSGNHFPGTSAVSPIAGTYRLNVPAWIQGSFRCGGAAVNGVLLQQAHLTSNPAWHLVEGNFADGVVTI
jgi:hypothetical protein